VQDTQLSGAAVVGGTAVRRRTASCCTRARPGTPACLQAPPRHTQAGEREQARAAYLGLGRQCCCRTGEHLQCTQPGMCRRCCTVPHNNREPASGGGCGGRPWLRSPHVSSRVAWSSASVLHCTPTATASQGGPSRRGQGAAKRVDLQQAPDLVHTDMHTHNKTRHWRRRPRKPLARPAVTGARRPAITGPPAWRRAWP